MSKSVAPAASPEDQHERRWALIRDVLVFQVKMLLEALRDVLLPVATLIAGALGMILGGERPDRYFHKVLRLGARFDVWLNLFGPIGLPGRAGVGRAGVGRSGVLAADAGVDRTLRYLEDLLVEQHQKGQVTRQAKQAIDRWLDQVQGAVRSTRRDRNGED